METLLSYRLSDLLLFSEQTYLRQFELYNQWIFPAQPIMLLLGFAFLILLKNPPRYFTRLLFMLSASLCLWVAYGFLWQFYLNINWMIKYFIALFILQAIILLWKGFSLIDNNTAIIRQRNLYSAGLVLWISAMFAFPAIELVSGRTLSQLSSFALTPDTLCSAILGLTLIFRLHWLSILPAALWLIFSALTYAAMDSFSALLLVFILSVFLAAHALRYLPSKKSRG